MHLVLSASALSEGDGNLFPALSGNDRNSARANNGSRLPASGGIRKPV